MFVPGNLGGYCALRTAQLRTGDGLLFSTSEQLTVLKKGSLKHITTLATFIHYFLIIGHLAQGIS